MAELTHEQAQAEAEKILLMPRRRQRLAEDEIEAIEQKYNVRILGVIKTVNGGQQVITWEVVALPAEAKELKNPHGTDRPTGGGQGTWYPKGI